MAEGVFQSLVASAPASTRDLVSTIDSCGTGAYHVGDSPDSRTMATLRQNGAQIEDMQLHQADLEDVFIEIMEGSK